MFGFKIKDRDKALKWLENDKAKPKDFADFVLLTNMDVASKYATKFGFDSRISKLVDNNYSILKNIALSSKPEVVDYAFRTIINKVNAGMMSAYYLHNTECIKELISLYPESLVYFNGIKGLGYSNKELVEYGRIAISKGMYNDKLYNAIQLQDKVIASNLLKNNGDAYLNQDLLAEVKNSPDSLMCALLSTSDKRAVFAEYLRLGNKNEYSIIARYVTRMPELMPVVYQLINEAEDGATEYVKNMLINGVPIYYMPDIYKNDEDLAYFAVSRNLQINNLSCDLLSNPKFVLRLATIKKLSLKVLLKYVNCNLFANPDFVLELIKTVPAGSIDIIFQYTHNSLLSNAEFIKKAIKQNMEVINTNNYVARETIMKNDWLKDFGISFNRIKKGDKTKVEATAISMVDVVCDEENHILK